MQVTAQDHSYLVSFDLVSNGLSLIRLIDEASSHKERSDINQDGEVDILDLQLCINVISGKDQTPLIIQRSDVDGNGTVDQYDTQLIAMRILGFNQ